MVTTGSPRPMRAVQRARLCASTCTASPGAVGWEAARGEMVQPHAVLEVANGILDLGVAPMVGLQFQGFPVPVGDAAVISAHAYPLCQTGRPDLLSLRPRVDTGAAISWG